MPEGDTIHRAARTLNRVLAGGTLTAARSTAPRAPAEGLAGLSVERVEARGKNLLVHLSDGRVLHTHMRMTGSWHVYRPGERWQRPARQARFVLETADWIAVCFDAPVIALLGRTEARHAPLSSLGPDLLATDFDLAEARRRLRERDALEIGEALMDQRTLAGIGNVYKSETLFLCGMDPFRAVADLSDRDLDRVVSRARALMTAGAGAGSPRSTRPSLSAAERTWVCGRKSRPCRRCRTPIRMRRQGATARSTYWCPSCQENRTPAPAGSGSPTADG